MRSLLSRKRREEQALKKVDNGEKRTVILSPDKKSATIFGFQPNSVNYAQIAVMNGQNDGPLSAPITFRTKEGGVCIYLVKWFFVKTHRKRLIFCLCFE